jgi:hypothetical protein
MQNKNGKYESISSKIDHKDNLPHLRTRAELHATTYRWDQKLVCPPRLQYEIARLNEGSRIILEGEGVLYNHMNLKMSSPSRAPQSHGGNSRPPNLMHF